MGLWDIITQAPLDDYAARNHAEFFAVATEAFFCTPERLRVHLPDLYEQLRHFFRQDPGAVPGDGRGASSVVRGADAPHRSVTHGRAP